MPAERPISAAGVVLIDDGKVLLVRRGQPPLLGGWSLPGGKQEPGETIRACALRELKEETGLGAEIAGLIDVVDLQPPDEGAARQYVLVDFLARPTGGTLEAGSDVSEAAWHNLGDLASLGLWEETLRIIRAGSLMLETGKRRP